MSHDPLTRAISRRRELLARNSALRAEIEQNAAEIERIEGAMAVLRNYAPPEGLPGLDENIPAAYGDLRSMTIPDACATILRKRGEALTARELLNLLVKAGKVKEANNNAMIGVIGALKRNPHRFYKVGGAWTLAESNGHLPGSEEDEPPTVKG